MARWLHGTLLAAGRVYTDPTRALGWCYSQPPRLRYVRRTLVGMSRPVEVLHEGRWLPATLLDTRLDPDGWHGLVGYSDPATRQGYYHWCPKAQLRWAPGQVDEVGSAKA